MSRGTRVLVDTNVIFDVLHGDPNWSEWSRSRLETFADGLVINPLIYSELCYQAESVEEVDEVVAALGLDLVELPREALFLAAKAFRKYREQGGPKTSPLADFFIGAHAEVASLPVLTRDVKRYRTSFPSVALICP